MKQITLNIPESEFSFFMKLINSLNFVQLADTSKEDTYNPEFVAKIEKSRKDYKEGKGKTITVNELNALWK